jgi:hypothetical protein
MSLQVHLTLENRHHKMNKKLTALIALQALIIILLFWGLVFYAKDEYESYQSKDEEEIESPSKVTEVNNINIIHLTSETQKNSGITTSKVVESHYQGTLKTFGTVIAIDSLIEAKTQYANLKSELQLAQTDSDHHITQYQRLKTLNEDDKNVSDTVVQDTLALVNADKAKIAGIQSQLSNLIASIKLQWGDVLSKLVVGETSATYLNNLLTRKNVLVQISLPLNVSTPIKESTIYIHAFSENAPSILATYVSPATASDITGTGKTFYYSAPAESLRTGMRISASPKNHNNDTKGVLVPNSAVIWHDGKPWIYIKVKNEQFQRTPISADVEVGDSWFNQNLKPDTEIVTSGAQLLLSEEFKYLIKNENED